MFGKKALPIGVMIMLPVVALAALGVGYGLWSETLNIGGTVSTGEVDVGFLGPYVEEGVDVGGEYQPAEPEEVASCSATSQTTSPMPDDGVNLLQVEVENAYPSYHCKVSFAVQSVGSVPVLVYQPVPSVPVGPLVTIESCYADGTYLAELGYTAPCVLDIHFTDDSGIDENSDYTFAFTVEARQWNEPR